MSSASSTESLVEIYPPAASVAHSPSMPPASRTWNTNIQSHLFSGAEDWQRETSSVEVIEKLIARVDTVSRDNERLFEKTDEQCSEIINLKAEKHALESAARITMIFLRDARNHGIRIEELQLKVQEQTEEITKYKRAAKGNAKTSGEVLGVADDSIFRIEKLEAETRDLKAKCEMLDGWVAGLSSKTPLRTKVCVGVKSAYVEEEEDDAAAVTLNQAAKVLDIDREFTPVCSIHHSDPESIRDNYDLAGQVAEMRGISSNP